MSKTSCLYKSITKANMKVFVPRHSFKSRQIYRELRHYRDCCNKGCLTALIFCLCAAEMKSEFNILKENYIEKVDSSLCKLSTSKILYIGSLVMVESSEDQDVNHKMFSFCNSFWKRRARYKSCRFHHPLPANIFIHEISLAL